MPLSGAMSGYKGDVTLDLPDGERMTGEVKVRKNAKGWQMVLQWLEGMDLLFLRDNTKTGQFIVVMPWETFQGLIVARHEWGIELKRRHGDVGDDDR